MRIFSSEFVNTCLKIQRYPNQAEFNMHKLLQINTSIFSDHGESSQLTNSLVASLKAKHPGAEFVKRDLAADPIPHLDGATFMAFLANPDERTPGQQAAVAFSDALIEELKSSDMVVIGLPLYNLDIPSTLKSYFDQISRAGVTFQFTEQGPKGLLNDRKVYIIATRGGKYSNTPLDTQTPLVKNFLGLIGITNVEFIYAEGLGMGEESKAAGLAAARTKLARITV